LKKAIPDILDFDKWRKRYTLVSAIVPLDSTIGFDFSTRPHQSESLLGDDGELYLISRTPVAWAWRGLTVGFEAGGALRIGEVIDGTAKVHSAQILIVGPGIEATLASGLGENAGFAIFETENAGYITLRLATGEGIVTPAWAPLLPDHIALRLPFTIKEDGSWHFSTPAGGIGSGHILPSAWWSSSDFDRDGILNKTDDYGAFVQAAASKDSRTDINFDDRIDENDIQLFMERLNEDLARDAY